MNHSILTVCFKHGSMLQFSIALLFLANFLKMIGIDSLDVAVLALLFFCQYIIDVRCGDDQ